MRERWCASSLLSWRRKTEILVLLVGLSSTGCAALFGLGGETKEVDKTAKVNQNHGIDAATHHQALENKELNYREHPGDPESLLEYANAMRVVFVEGEARIEQMEWGRRLPELTAALEKALAPQTSYAPELASRLHHALGFARIAGEDSARGIAELEVALKLDVTVELGRDLLSMYANAERRSDMNQLCKQVYGQLDTEDDIIIWIDICVHARDPNVDTRTALSWVSDEHWEAYKVELTRDRSAQIAQAAEEERAREEALERQRAQERGRVPGVRKAGSSNVNWGASSRPSQPSSTSITLYSDCKSTMKIFIGTGNDPRFGSGKHTTHNYNTQSSYSIGANEQLWLVGDDGRGLAAVSGSGRRDWKITSSCTGIVPR